MFRNLIRKFIVWAISDDLGNLHKHSNEKASLIADEITKRIKTSVEELHEIISIQMNHERKNADANLRHLKKELIEYIHEAINDSVWNTSESIREFVREEIAWELGSKEEEVIPTSEPIVKVKEKTKAMYFSVEPGEEVDFFRVISILPSNLIKAGDRVYNPHTQEIMKVSMKGSSSNDLVFNLKLVRGLENTLEKPILPEHKLLIL